MERSIAVFAMGVAHWLPLEPQVQKKNGSPSTALRTSSDPPLQGLLWMTQCGAWQAFYAARCGFSLPGSAGAAVGC
jgi:hypothetical protein